VNARLRDECVFRADVQESRQTSGRLTEEHHVAKSGGKADSKRKEKRAEKQRGKAAPAKLSSVKRGADKSGPAKSGKVKALKARRTKGTQRLVERVASEIVIAELDRAVGEVSEAPEAPAESAAAVSGEAAVAPEQAPAAEETQDAASPAADEDDADEDETDDELASDLTFAALLRTGPGPVDLEAIDPASTPGASSRSKAEAELPKLAKRLGELQERLFAAARGGDSKRRVLLVLQGMDTSGKGGTVRHVVSLFDPNGTKLTAFKAPTEEERSHDFLWRIRNALPAAGEVGIFDRSHYEDVLIARVRKLALPMVIGKRYQLINKFEQGLVADGAVVVKCFLHISPQEQKERLLARLDDPQKLWKYNPGDVDERTLWPQYQEAYRLALEKCSTEAAPWHVIPADHKWYRNYAITRLLVEALEQIAPEYPPGEFDVEVERKRVLAS
jgi:PPK2 family polyphosphate:nucleotide phosphotransferase